jgi:hypothetical protein
LTAINAGTIYTRFCSKTYEYPDGDIKVFYEKQELKYNMLYDRVNPLPQGEIIADNKYLAEVLEYAAIRRQQLPPKTRSRNCTTCTHLKYIA